MQNIIILFFQLPIEVSNKVIIFLKIMLIIK
jgi:hypothetical protein